MDALTDKEILELHSLCDAVVDDTLTHAQRARLQSWLMQSEAARRHYVLRLGQSASLHHYASEMHAEAPDRPSPAPTAARPVPFGWWAASLAAAAALAAVIWITVPRAATSGAEPTPSSYVARLTGASDCRWAGQDGAPAAGSRLKAGQRLDLTAGFAEITFDSGAQIVLQGPALLDVNSAWDGTLRRGALRAVVPAEAIGFRISHPTVDVVDLGTEFSMVADAAGADVLVTKGEVEAAPHASGDQDAILLRAKESRRFASSGVSAVVSPGAIFAPIAQPVSFQRLASTTAYAQWAQPTAPESHGLAQPAQPLRLYNLASGEAEPAPGSAGRAHALRFDGHLYASAKYPGISGNGPHTISFWANVPANAPLINSFAMVAWGVTGKKFSAHPVHIGWNRNPSEGPLGALRTDFGGGSAMGLTSLRDGRWHHIAVVFIPGDERGGPVQVQQYVDGHLESSAVNPPGRTPRLSPSKAVTSADLTDQVYLGIRLGAGGLKNEHFVGSVSDLFIADGTLEPAQIVALMHHNRLAEPAGALAGAF